MAGDGYISVPLKKYFGLQTLILTSYFRRPYKIWKERSKMDSVRWSSLFVIFILLISASAHSAEVSKEVWVDSMSTALPTLFCQANQYFRQCFDVSQVECEDTAMSATRVCLQKYKDQIPNTLVQPKDGTYWGRIVGKCAGEAYEITLRKKRISNQKCNDPNNWK